MMQWMIAFTLNGDAVTTDTDPETPLLWVVRDAFKLKGTKFGCGAGLCGACTVHVDGAAQRSCILPVEWVKGRDVRTIEGLGAPDNLHPLQVAWHDHNVSQCGYCQPGQIMSAAALLAENPTPDARDVREAMAGNLCRCGCYGRILDAILTVADAEDRS